MLGSFPIYIFLCQEVVVERDKFPFYILMGFQSFTCIILELGDVIMHAMLKGGMMEEGRIALPFPEPLDSGFLHPEGFFLFSALLNLGEKKKLLQIVLLYSSIQDDLLL